MKKIHIKYRGRYMLERAFIDLAIEMGREKGMKKFSDFARFVWGETHDDIYSKWRDLRGTKTKEPQALTVRDAVLIADAFGKTLPEMFYTAGLKLNAGWSPEHIPQFA